MDHNEITMDMDVKMDLKEKKFQYFQLRTWTRCTVKIEAMKYIPCFVKITVIPNGNDDKSNVVIKINIPGLSVKLANSRSKVYSYGLFWTHYRKNCCIFFALDSKADLDRHANWVKNSITNLEIHRREMLESRRASRISGIDDNVTQSENSCVERCNDTQNIRDINEVLGPLPNVPDSNINWSRRVSTTSEIYEEIGDHRILNRKLSRTSIASGIYEVMTSPLVSIEESARILEEMPPPLPPPRPRVNTQTEMNRTYTNPESISAKKRKRNIFETVFSRHKSMHKQKSPKPKGQTTKAESPVIELLRSHRMSYSSPDLSKDDANHYVHEFESDLMARSSAEFSRRNENSFLNSTTTSDKEIVDDDRNISENILSNFNIDCNDSAVNLVGSNLNGNIEKPQVATIIDHVSGYCQMAPIIRSSSAISPVSAPELPTKSPLIFDTFGQQRIPVDVSKTITFRRDYDMEASLQNFENLTISKESSQRPTKDIKVISPPSPAEQIQSNHLTVSCNTRNYNNSFDEKYPSYYPKTPLKDHQKVDGLDFFLAIKPHTPNPKRAENVYIALPRHGSCRSTKKSKESSKLKVLSPTNSLTTPDASHLLTPTMKSTSSASSLLYQKYATVTPIKESASCKKSNEISGGMKRFSSLPRFKKIDFSPLKFKISSVLQRQNPDQM